MLNHQKYIQMIDSTINRNFSLLDRTIESCDRLQEARSLYYHALNEYYLGTDNQKRNPQKYQDALTQAEQKMSVVKQDISSYVCDRYHTIEPLTVGLIW